MIFEMYVVMHQNIFLSMRVYKILYKIFKSYIKMEENVSVMEIIEV